MSESLGSISNVGFLTTCKPAGGISDGSEEWVCSTLKGGLAEVSDLWLWPLSSKLWGQSGSSVAGMSLRRSQMSNIYTAIYSDTKIADVYACFYIISVFTNFWRSLLYCGQDTGFGLWATVFRRVCRCEFSSVWSWKAQLGSFINFLHAIPVVFSKRNNLFQVLLIHS